MVDKLLQQSLENTITPNKIIKNVPRIIVDIIVLNFEY